MKFDNNHFQEFKFSTKEINQCYKNAQRDLLIAKKDNFPEARFVFSYQALIKLGIALISKVGNVKVRSIPGHHFRILEKMSEILNDKQIAKIGNIIRTKRNTDFYGGGEVITDKEAEEYLEFVEKVFKKAKKVIEGG